MTITELKKISEAPTKGYILAYTRTNVLFHEYSCLDEIMSELDGKELLEIHLFDKNREYRAAMSESHRFNNGIIEPGIVAFDDCTMPFKALIENSRDEISMIGHVSYDPDNGMAYIDNYRLSM